METFHRIPGGSQFWHEVANRKLSLGMETYADPSGKMLRTFETYREMETSLYQLHCTEITPYPIETSESVAY